jgi:hypothetical protein
MVDLKQTADGDLDLSTGDVQWVEPTGQHQRDILLARPGDYKTSPLTGVGLEDYLLSDKPDNLLAEIRRQMTADGQDVSSVRIQGKQIRIDASYK